MSKPPHSQRGQRQIQAPQQTPQQRTVQVREESLWSGPLPRPDDLAKFNNVLQNGAERVVAMAEKEQAHRIEYEAEGQRATIKESARGQYLGAGITALALVAAVYTAYIGAHWSVSVAFVSVTLLGIVRALIRPRGRQS